MAEPVRYADDLEQVADDEQEVTDQLIRTMLHTQDQVFEAQRHGTSATHAKSHGIVVGRLRIDAGLPPELAQGLFANPAEYDVVLRYASEPHRVEPDTLRRARGAALKILDVPGEKLRPDWPSQDFLFNTWPVIPQGDARTYLKAIEQRDEHFGHANRVRLGTGLRHPSSTELLFDRTPNLNPVAHSYYSQGAFRYGDHVAKFALIPTGDDTVAAGERTVSSDDPPGILRHWVSEYFEHHTATYDLRVQLCTDVEAMPIEDASVDWPQDDSPYRTVGSLTFPPQPSFSPARRRYAEDLMSWRPWYGLAAHRPLGSINRIRDRVYQELGRWRHEVNAEPEHEPTSPTDIPA